MKLRALLLAGTLAGTIGAAPVSLTAPTDLTDAADAAGVAVAEEGVGSTNVRHVKNLRHLDAEGKEPTFDDGSDIEFFTIGYRTRDYVQRFRPGNVRAADLDRDLANGVQRRYALAGTVGNGMHVYDITSPEDTFRVTRYDCPANQGDPQIFTREEDGRVRTFTTYTTEDSRPVSGDTVCGEQLGVAPDASLIGTFIIEITDPYAPKAVGFIDVPEGSHNGTVHPSGLFFYNSNSSLYKDTAEDGGPGIEYYDISDVTAPERLGRLPLVPITASLGTESHDITFNEDGTRAYSAALSQGVIIDTSDPANPVILTQWVDPTIQVWHQSDPIQVGDRTLLVVEDEVAGAVGTGQCPNGGVHVFDVTDDPTVPEKLGYWNIDEARVMAADGSYPAGTCTAHVFRLHPEEGIMTIAYYNGGVRIVDLAGLAGVGLGERAIAGDDPMVQLGWHRFPDSNAWAAKTPGIEEDGSFYLFSNDLDRGLDVYHFTGDADPAAAAQGRWMTAAEAATVLRPATTAAGSPGAATARAYSCVLR